MIETPVIAYSNGGQERVFVKREDLSCPSPGPPFAKVRGLLPVLEDLKQRGVTTVGYMETAISMAGWGISYFCQKLGMKAVIFMPQYKNGLRHNQLFQLGQWRKFGAEVLELEKPNRLQINFYRARKQLIEKYPGAIMLPQGLPFVQTVHEVCEQLKNIDRDILRGSIVCCIGSGTMMAGVLKGCAEAEVSPDCYGILVSIKGTGLMRKKVLKMASLKDRSFFNRLTVKFSVIDYGYEYTQRENCESPFPCNPYYDKKAWKWLLDNKKSLKKPVLFWNIGA